MCVSMCVQLLSRLRFSSNFYTDNTISPLRTYVCMYFLFKWSRRSSDRWVSKTYRNSYCVLDMNHGTCTMYLTINDFIHLPKKKCINLSCNSRSWIQSGIFSVQNVLLSWRIWIRLDIWATYYSNRLTPDTRLQNTLTWRFTGKSVIKLTHNLIEPVHTPTATTIWTRNYQAYTLRLYR